MAGARNGGIHGNRPENLGRLSIGAFDSVRTLPSRYLYSRGLSIATRAGSRGCGNKIKRGREVRIRPDYGKWLLQTAYCPGIFHVGVPTCCAISAIQNSNNSCKCSLSSGRPSGFRISHVELYFEIYVGDIICWFFRRSVIHYSPVHIIAVVEVSECPGTAK